MGSAAKSYMRKIFLTYENAPIFPHTWGGRWSFMTLHPILLNFLIYGENFIFFCISVRSSWDRIFAEQKRCGLTESTSVWHCNSNEDIVTKYKIRKNLIYRKGFEKFVFHVTYDATEDVPAMDSNPHVHSYPGCLPHPAAKEYYNVRTKVRLSSLGIYGASSAGVKWYRTPILKVVVTTGWELCGAPALGRSYKIRQRLAPFYDLLSLTELV
jgi:hypothetical protein